MTAHQIYSNNRKLSFEEMQLVHLTATFPESSTEPSRMTKLRRRAESALYVASEIPGSIIDSLDYEFLKRVKKLYE